MCVQVPCVYILHTASAVTVQNKDNMPDSKLIEDQVVAGQDEDDDILSHL